MKNSFKGLISILKTAGGRISKLDYGHKGDPNWGQRLVRQLNPVLTNAGTSYWHSCCLLLILANAWEDGPGDWALVTRVGEQDGAAGSWPSGE